MKAKIYNYNNWIRETDPKILSDRYDSFLKQSGFSVLGQLEYYFNPYGYTKLWLLGESHLAIHTFPEEEKTYVELSSCNEGMYNKFLLLQGKEILTGI